jgi:hypothetical protein
VTASRAEGSKEGDGDAAAAVANAVKRGDDEEEEDIGVAAALPHAMAPVGAPSVCSCGVAEGRRGCDVVKNRVGYCPNIVTNSV